MSPDTLPAPLRPADALAMLGAGVACVIAGGLVAAVTDPLDLQRGSWAAAYLVLVGGVAQVAMGLARWAAAEPHGWSQFGLWNVGNALVIAGTLTAVPLVVDAGGVALVGALALALRQSRSLPSGMPRLAFRVVLAVVLLSIPVGLVLAHLR